jgi:hypothetical protein
MIGWQRVPGIRRHHGIVIGINAGVISAIGSIGFRSDGIE